MIAVVGVALTLVATLTTIGTIGACLLAWHYRGPRKGECWTGPTAYAVTSPLPRCWWYSG